MPPLTGFSVPGLGVFATEAEAQAAIAKQAKKTSPPPPDDSHEVEDDATAEKEGGAS